MARSWDDVLDKLSSLIAFKNRADGNSWRDAFENMAVYLQRVDMTEDVKKLRVIHVAGTKGKGSTCAMVEAMLRQCGYRTGLYTSPHLIDVRERIRIDGLMVDRAVFEENFWWCYDRFQQQATPEVGVPGYFRFMTLLALKVFVAQGVDVVVLEVGVGGRLDATNIIPAPVVCGITSLGMDHMEILGDTLPKIAREKAGILKRGRPGFTVWQPDDAMEALQDCAAKAGTELAVVESLNMVSAADGQPPTLALKGTHMLVNAGLAVKLASEWERHTDIGQSHPGSAARLALLDQGKLPEEYARGLAAVEWPGRSQVVEDVGEASGQHHEAIIAMDGGAAGTAAGEVVAPANAVKAGTGVSGGGGNGGGRLTFFIDGAHTPESMATCADWFGEQATAAAAGPSWDVRRILLFNCMKERDPAVLLPTLARGLSAKGVHFHHALFVPPDSQYGFLPTSKKPTPSTPDGVSPIGPASATSAGAGGGVASGKVDSAPDAKVVVSAAADKVSEGPDLSWQSHMQQVWESQSLGASASATAVPQLPSSAFLSAAAPARPQEPWSAAVVPSLSHTVEWLRQYARSSPRLQLQVLVTGSLYLVGDVLRMLGKLPK